MQGSQRLGHHVVCGLEIWLRVRNIRINLFNQVELRIRQRPPREHAGIREIRIRGIKGERHR